MTAPTLVVQHGADDPPGRLGRWLVEAGCPLLVVRCHLGEPLPASLSGMAGLVVLGGMMGAYDDHRAAWLPATKALLRQGVAEDVPTLGVCLGHQLLAVAAGGRVQTATAPQQGVVPVTVTADAADDPLFSALGGRAAAVHWNNDLVVQAPPGAVVLSRSPAGIQGFRVGTHAWGVQCHPEVDPDTVAGWGADDVAAGRQPAERVAALLRGIREADDELEHTWAAFVRRFSAQVLQRARRLDRQPEPTHLLGDRRGVLGAGAGLQA